MKCKLINNQNISPFDYFLHIFSTIYPRQVRAVRGGHAGHRAGRGHLHRGAAGDRPQPRQRRALLRGLPQVTRATCPGSVSPPAAMSGTWPRRWCRAARAAASPCAAPPAPWRPSTAAWSAACSSGPGPASTSGEQRKYSYPRWKYLLEMRRASTRWRGSRTTRCWRCGCCCCGSCGPGTGPPSACCSPAWRSGGRWRPGSTTRRRGLPSSGTSSAWTPSAGTRY